jgi:hypothetical protein
MSGNDAELDQMRASVSCAVLLERLPPPWRLDKRQSTRRCLKYRRAEGEILLVTHEGRGWWDPCSSAKGDVFRLVQFLEPSLSFRQVRNVLRPFIGRSPSYPFHERRLAKERPLIPFNVKWERRRHVPVDGSPVWHYLAQIRGLPAAVISAAVAAGVLREGPYGTAWFAHTDHAGHLTGIEMRGPAYRGFSPGGTKALFRLPGHLGFGATAMHRVVLAEAPIDAMSLAAVEHMRADTLYAATAGGMGPATVLALNLLFGNIASAPDAMVVAATDADKAGTFYAARLSEMAQEAGVSFERLLPPDGLKDWNDVLGAGEGIRRATIARNFSRCRLATEPGWRGTSQPRRGDPS